MIFACNRCVACVKFDALFGKGVDALCEARCRLEHPDYGVHLDAGEIFLTEVKSTLENAARNILTTLGTGVISRLKVRKIFVLYRRVNARLSAQYSRAKVTVEKSYRVKIIELPSNIAETDPALVAAFRLK
jgi:hypothetical protein